MSQHRKWVSVPAATAAAISALLGSDGLVLRMLVVAAIWAILVAICETICIRFRWTHTDHPKKPKLRSALRRERGLRRVLWTGAIAQVAVAVVPFVVAWPDAALFHIALLALLVFAMLVQTLPLLFQPAVQTRIKLLVGDNTRSRKVAKTPVWEDETLEDVLANVGAERRFFLHRALAALFASRVHVSLYTVAIWFSVLGIMAIDAGAMIREGASPLPAHVARHHAGAPTSPRPKPKPPTAPAPSASESTPPAVGLGSLPTSSSAEVTWASMCGPLPGSDAPAWAQPLFLALYLGSNGPGAKAGCTGATQYVVGDSSFAYLIGYENGSVKSVAVVTEQTEAYPPALFMAPAAEPVLELIRTEGAVGGTGRLNAAVGDLYLVYEASGTMALTRANKDGAYTVVPPAVVDEWFADMTLRDEWLWPVREADDPQTGNERFRFDTASGERTALSVEYDAHMRDALIPTSSGTVQHRADGRRLPPTALRQFGAVPDPNLPGINPSPSPNSGARDP